MPGWLKSGLIGAAALFLLQLINLFPLLVCVTLPLSWMAYVVVGALAASYLPPTRSAGQGAGHGALAALIAGLVGGLVSLIISVLQASGGATAQVISQIPSDVLQALRDAGIPPRFIAGVGGASICGSICCGFGTMIAALLGAIGGGIYAAAKPE